MTEPRISDAERRARLGVRHLLAAGSATTATGVARAVTALHATEAASVYLSVAARSTCSVADIDTALFEQRSLVRQLAMRRTMFVFPRDLLPAAWGAPSARVALSHGRRIIKTVEANQLGDGAAWLEQAQTLVTDELAAAPDGLTTTQIRQRIPALAGKITVSPGTKWGGEIPVAPWILTQLGLHGRIVRTTSDVHWRQARYRWQLTEHWLGEPARPLPEREGYAEIVRGYLAGFGPVTSDDVQWWLGSTKKAVAQALADLDARPVRLDDDSTGWLLPDDLQPVEAPDDWAALLPTLDPATMGWKQRDFYLDPAHRPYLFDSNGNGGTTAWLNGRIVGCWVQDDQARVRVVLRDDLPASQRRLLDDEAERLTEWLDGVRISSVYASQQMKAALLP